MVYVQGPRWPDNGKGPNYKHRLGLALADRGSVPLNAITMI